MAAFDYQAVDGRGKTKRVLLKVIHQDKCGGYYAIKA